ncbi:MAG: hypothetical protein IJI41_02685 [Anaerolineaceae bacterium]|nr:hypothetical protein [Anaerolineaceae bacterium]
MSWLDDEIAKDMKDPEFKKAWDKYECEDKVIQYMIDNNITITQDFLDVLDDLSEKGISFGLFSVDSPVESKKKAKEPKSDLEYA